MISPVHISFNLAIYFLISKLGVLGLGALDLLCLLSAELIDFDHFFAKPIYNPQRNSFKTHFFHRNWKYIGIISVLLFFYRPLMFLGIGLLSHLLLDCIYNKIHKI